jgi:tRNA-splicing ligase RtcB
MFQIHHGVRVWGDPVDERAIRQAERCVRSSSEALGAALMADHHVGYSQPIGGVVVYDSAVSPFGVGYDIGCGNSAVLTNLRWESIAADLPAIMDSVFEEVSFGIGSTAENGDHAIFRDPRWDAYDRLGSGVREQMLDLGRAQLGSVGSGNHYVDLFRDDDDRIWVGVHFGSRGLGHRSASGFLNVARGRRFGDRAPGESMDQPPTVLRFDSELGARYWQVMELAGDYARIGRDLVLEQVLAILGARGEFWVRNNHNLAWRERQEIDGAEREVIVVRKGATPAFPGQLGFVGGSMGDDALIVRGRDSDEASLGFFSTVHGAGRVMSRTQAAGKLNWKTGRRSGGAVTREMMLAWLDDRGVVLRGGDTDESPQAYKRLDAVIAHHLESVEVVHRLHPIGVAMAGAGEFDPYKD